MSGGGTERAAITGLDPQGTTGNARWLVLALALVALALATWSAPVFGALALPGLVDGAIGGGLTLTVVLLLLSILFAA